MTKKLNTDAITNELAESVFFRTPQSGQASASPGSGSAVPAGGKSPSVPPVPPVRGVPPKTRPGKRVMKQRHPFDIYEDQYHSLQELSLADRRAPAKSSARGPRSAGLARYAGAGGSCTGVAAPLAGIHMLRGDRSILLEATLPGPWGNTPRAVLS